MAHPKYRGITKLDVRRNVNTASGHDNVAADLSMVLKSPLYAGFPGDAIAKFVFIRVNKTDPNPKYKGVKYSAIRDLSNAGGYELWYLHTDNSPHKVGDQIRSGDLVCYTAKNGIMTGPHAHFEVRKDGKHLNPNDTMQFRVSGGIQYLLGFPTIVPVPPVDETVALKRQLAEIQAKLTSALAVIDTQQVTIKNLQTKIANAQKALS